jgi:hypothetical protein
MASHPLSGRRFTDGRFTIQRLREDTAAHQAELEVVRDRNRELQARLLRLEEEKESLLRQNAVLQTEVHTQRRRISSLTDSARRQEQVLQGSQEIEHRVQLFMRELHEQAAEFLAIAEQHGRRRTVDIRLPFEHIRTIAHSYGLDCFSLGGFVPAACGGTYRAFIVFEAGEFEHGKIAGEWEDGVGSEGISRGEPFIVLEDEDCPHVFPSYTLYGEQTVTLRPAV